MVWYSIKRICGTYKRKIYGRGNHMENWSNSISGKVITNDDVDCKNYGILVNFNMEFLVFYLRDHYNNSNNFNRMGERDIYILLWFD